LKNHTAKPASLAVFLGLELPEFRDISDWTTAVFKSGKMMPSMRFGFVKTAITKAVINYRSTTLEMREKTTK
jgi:hypothetical protein